MKGVEKIVHVWRRAAASNRQTMIICRFRQPLPWPEQLKKQRFTILDHE
jgi:hypothetical protein